MEIVKPVELDLLDQQLPALSSTNDMPSIETKPDAVAAPETKVEGKTEEESATPPESPSASDEPKKAKGVQKRLDELTKQREDERRRAEAAEQRLDRALAALENKPKVEVTDEPLKPSKDDFPDPDAWDQALLKYSDEKASWTAQREIKAMMAEQEKKAQETAIADSQKQLRDTYMARVEKVREKYADFQEVAESPEVRISMPMVQAILTSEQGPDLQYYLGKNPSEAQRISSMTVKQYDPNAKTFVDAPNVAAQLMELGLIMAKLREPSKPVISAAPRPIKPLTAGNEPSQKSAEEESMEEYAARRNKELGRDMRH